MNPWIEIWVRPRAVIRHIVDTNPNRFLWWLAAIYGFDSLMNNSQRLGLGLNYSDLMIFLFSIIFCSIWGYLIFSLWSAVLHWTGKLLKGQGTFQAVRAAYAWSCVPLAINILLWVLLGVVFTPHLFTPTVSGAETITNAQVFILFFTLIGRLILVVWSLVIFFNALAEVQRYSILKAILNTVFAAIFLAIVFWVLLWIGAHLFYSGAQMPIHALRELIR